MNYIKVAENEYKPILGTPRTLFLYNQQFGRNLLFDLSESISGSEIINNSLASKILWTLCLTANKNEYEFNVWLKKIKFNFDSSWRKILIRECNRAFQIDLDVENEHEEKNKSKSTMSDNEVAISILVNSKKMGLSFDELDTFTLNDYIHFSEIYSGHSKPQKASQDDIDNFFR